MSQHNEESDRLGIDDPDSSELWMRFCLPLNFITKFNDEGDGTTQMHLEDGTFVTVQIPFSEMEKIISAYDANFFTSKIKTN